MLADESQPTEVRIHLVRRLRNGRVAAEERLCHARYSVDSCSGRQKLELRLQAALALGEFADIEGIVAMLGTLALATDKPIDLRYAAFTSVQPGPTPDPSRYCRSVVAMKRSVQLPLMSWPCGERSDAGYR